MRCFSMRVKGQRKISLVLSLLIGFILIAGAAVAVPVPVLALSAGGIKTTIASLVISLMLQAGVAPTNTQWLNQLNSAYGVSSTIGTIEDCITNGLLTETASGLVDSGLSSAISNLPEYTSLGLSEIFTTSASDAGVVAASGATNLANTAINVGTLGTIGAFAGAAAVGVGVGILANHLIQKYVNNVRLGLAMNNTDSAFNLSDYGSFIRIGYVSSYYGSPPSIVDVASNSNVIFAHGDQTAYAFNKGDTQSRLYKKKQTGGGSWEDSFSDVFRNNYTSIGLSYVNSVPHYKFDGGIGFATDADAINYMNGLKNGTINPPSNYSPDLIGPGGNLRVEEDMENPGTYTIPGVQNIIPDGSDMYPVDMDDYDQYVDGANQNTDDGLIDENNQGQGFTNFVTPYITDIPDSPVIPDQPIIPENPDVVPTYPDRPVSPEQPTIPDKPDISDEELESNLNLTATPDLRGIFPFCIPWDIYNLVLIFDSGSRQAPHITFTFPGTDWVIDVDLSAFDPVAGILRVLELMLFIVGLMVATRSLIGAGG